MAKTERVEHLNTVRADMVERRFFYAARLIDTHVRESESAVQEISEYLLQTQAVIEVIDKAIADESAPNGSVYEHRGIRSV